MRSKFMLFVILIVSMSGLEVRLGFSMNNAADIGQLTVIDTIYVNVLMRIPANQFSIFNNQVGHSITINMSAIFSEPLTDFTRLTSYLFFEPLNIMAIAIYHGGDKRLIQPVLMPMGFSSIVALYLPFDIDLESFEVMIEGRQDGTSLIWRNVVELMYVLPTFSQPMPIIYKVSIEAPDSVDVTSLSSPPPEQLIGARRSSQVLNITEVIENGFKIYTLTQPVYLVIHYMPGYWLILASCVTFLTILGIIFMPHLIRRFPLKILDRIMIMISDSGKKIRSVLSPEKLFTLFMLCSILIISLSLFAGPDPRIKIYAIASESTVSFIEGGLRSELSQIQVIGIEDTVSEFSTMANLGIINAVIVSDCPVVALERISKFVIGSLNQIPVVIIDNARADPGLARAVEERYDNTLIVVDSTEDLFSTKTIQELRGLQRYNYLGFQSQTGFYNLSLIIIAILSFLEAFLGMAFISSRLIETGRRKGLGVLVNSIAISAFVFYFTQAVYMASSVSLAMPIGLHAVTSGSREITVVGVLGFGGGSSPRAVAGITGFLLGAYVVMKSNSEVDRFGFSAFIILLLLLAVEPFTGGELFYDTLLLFLSGPKTELLRSSVYYTKDIFSYVGRIFGGWASNMYGISTGEILYYIGAIPICLFPNVKRSTATLLLLLSSFFAAEGFIRTAEMTPYKTIASMIPGLALGLFSAILFLLCSFFEQYLRAKIGK